MIGNVSSTTTKDISDGLRCRPSGLVVSAVLGIGLMAVLIWQFAGVPVDGVQFQVLDPALPPVWKAVIVSTLGVSTTCTLMAWKRHGWTMRLAIVNAAANWVGTAAVLGLTLDGALFAPSLPTRVGATFGTSSDLSGLTELLLVILTGAAVWDSVDGFRRIRD